MFPTLAHDCENCAALCCVGLAFDKSDMFAIDKPAGVACPNLGADARCTIHADLEKRGFAGCIQYGCLGAGQRVTQELFQGQNWQDNPKILPDMLDAFMAMRKVHEHLQLLETAGKLTMAGEQRAVRDTLIDRLTPTEWTLETLRDFTGGDFGDDMRYFLTSLQDTARG